MNLLSKFNRSELDISWIELHLLLCISADSLLVRRQTTENECSDGRQMVIVLFSEYRGYSGKATTIGHNDGM